MRRSRWLICALLFAATTLNYVDRQVLGLLAPELGRTIGWSESQYSYIVAAFQAAYAIGLLSAGALIDRLGARLGYALAIALWSLAAMSHALARTVLQFATARFFLGLGESGNFPAAVKSVAEWFPPQERSVATGIFNAGSNFGAVLAALAVPVVAAAWGLQAAFLCTGVLSAIWLVSWLALYRTPATASIETSSTQPGPRWLDLLRHREAWAFVAAKLLTDPIWWFYLFWLPKFLHSAHGLELTQIGPPLITIYVMADIGSIAGGWLAARLMRAGWSLNRARKTALLVCALLVVPIVFASSAQRLWTAVVLIGLATAGHQGFSANLYALTTDLFPSRAIARIVGLGGFAGSVSGMLISTLIGWLLETTGSYASVFALASTAYLTALGAVQFFAPRLEAAPGPGGGDARSPSGRS
jgi:ACS family hexuronate transporter-like MFS transporter